MLKICENDYVFLEVLELKKKNIAILLLFLMFFIFPFQEVFAATKTTYIAYPVVNKLATVTQTNQQAFTVSGKGLGNATIYYSIKDKKNKVVAGVTKANKWGTFQVKRNVKYLMDGTLTVYVSQTKSGSKSKVAVKTVAKNTVVKKETYLANPVVNNMSVITQINQQAFAIGGKALGNATIYYSIKDTKNKIVSGTTKANNSGTFQVNPNVKSLNDGTLTVYVSQAKSGSKSKVVAKTVTKNTIGPAIVIPNTGKVFYNNQSLYKVEGKTEPYNTLKIAVKDAKGKVITKQTTANALGQYMTTFDLRGFQNGSLQLKMIATSKEGNIGTLVQKTIEKDDTYYELNQEEQAKWNIYNNGTHPLETTKGINSAILWAKNNSVKTFKVPEGTYMVAKADPKIYRDPNGCINMVSDMTFWADNKAVFQKETNGTETYSTICVYYGADNATIKGGQYRGEKDTHDYSKKETSGTHENGNGINIYGAKNVTVDGVTATNFTGDGMAIGGNGILFEDMYADEFESGSVDANGNLVADSTKIRMKKKIPLTNPLFQKEPYFEMPNASGLPYLYDIYFYQADGKFLSSYQVKKYKEVVNIPKGATSFIPVFKKSSPAGVYGEFWNKALATNITVKNSEFAFNRRQGITIGGADNVLITNNKLHDIKGTAPESGIDVEGGYGENGMMNKNIFIKNNQFYNNNRYDVILYDGHDAVVEGNYLGSKWKIGLAVSDPFTGATIKNNTFDTTQTYIAHDTTFIGNTMNNSFTHIDGPNVVVDGMTFNNADFAISSSKPFGVEVKNVVLNNSTLNIWVNPIHVTNATLNGGTLGGQAPNGSIFDNLKLYNSTGTSLIRGTYNNCVYETKEGVKDGMHVDYNSNYKSNSNYEFNNCTFKTGASGLYVGDKDANVTIQNSKFTTGDGSAIRVATANKINILNNTIQSTMVAGMNKAIIMIGDYWQKGNPYKVNQVSIKGNTITSNTVVEGITTIYGGTGAPSYEIRDNTLYKAKLNLKAEDVKSNNKEL